MSQHIRVQVATGRQGATGATGPRGVTGATGAGATGATGASGAGGGGGGGGSNAGFSVFEDFLAMPPYFDASNGGSPAAWWGGPVGLWIKCSSALTSQLELLDLDQLHPGVLYVGTHTFADGYAVISNGNPDFAPVSLRVGGGEMTFECLIGGDTASDGTNSYMLRAGIAGDVSDGPPVGIYFEGIDGVNSRKWVAVCDNGSRSTINSSVTVPASFTFSKLKFVVNAAGTSVEFFINGSSIGSITTTIPGYAMGVVVGIYKRAGTSARHLALDYLSIAETLTAAR